MGVWIETSHSTSEEARTGVTPYVGVWIETEKEILIISMGMSLLMWECGLKLKIRRLGASVTKSLLMWECGLKLTALRACIDNQRSLLMWECGLKQPVKVSKCKCHNVTPYVGVWIET